MRGASSGKDLMHIISDARGSWNERLPGWPSLPVTNPKGGDTRIPTGLWSQLSSDRPALLALGKSPGTGLDFWNQLYLVEYSKTSQYDILRDFFSRNPENPDCLACFAVSGENFHGQHGRPWQAVAGNLHLSVSVPLDLPAGPLSLVWTMLPAVAVMHTLEHLGIPNITQNAGCGIKWVNDVLWGGQKLAGVISSVVSGKGRIRRGYLGIGLNVAVAPEMSAGDASQESTCLHQELSPHSAKLGHILELILASLADLITEFRMNFGKNPVPNRTANIIQEYRRFSLVVGRQVRIVSDPLNGPGTEICRGKVLNINPDLSLVVEGYPHPVCQGRLFLQE